MSKQNENPYKKVYLKRNRKNIDDILTFDELDAAIKKEPPTDCEALEDNAKKSVEEKCTCAKFYQDTATVLEFDPNTA